MKKRNRKLEKQLAALLLSGLCFSASAFAMASEPDSAPQVPAAENVQADGSQQGQDGAAGVHGDQNQEQPQAPFWDAPLQKVHTVALGDNVLINKDFTIDTTGELKLDIANIQIAENEENQKQNIVNINSGTTTVKGKITGMPLSLAGDTTLGIINVNNGATMEIQKDASITLPNHFMLNANGGRINSTDANLTLDKLKAEKNGVISITNTALKDATIDNLKIYTGRGKLENVNLNSKGLIEAYGLGQTPIEDEDGKENWTINFKNSNIKGLAMESVGKDAGILLAGTDKNEYHLKGINVFSEGSVDLRGGKLYVSDFLGSFDGQSMKVATNTHGYVNIDGGTLVAPNLKSILDGSKLPSLIKEVAPNVTDNELKALTDSLYKDRMIVHLKGNGKIETSTNQIFEKAAGKDVVESGNVTTKNISYTGGTLVFTDPEYTAKYADDAEKQVKEYQKNIDWKKAEPEAYKAADAQGEDTLNKFKEGGSKSDTKLVFLGKEYNDGKEVTDVDIDKYTKSHIDGVSKNQSVSVKNEEGKTKLQLKTGAGDADAKVVDANIDATKLVLGDKYTEVEVEGKKLTLGTMENGNLFDGKNLQNVVLKQDAEFTIGSEAKPTENVINANVKLDGNNAKLNISNSAVTVENDKKVELGSGTLSITDDGLGVFNNGQLVLTDKSTITVGNENSRGELILNNVDLDGSKVFFDPTWENGTENSTGIINKDGALINLDGKVIVGQNSILTFGENRHNNRNQIRLSEDEIGAAVFFEKPVDLDAGNGVLLVDPTLTTLPEDGSLPNAKTFDLKDNTFVGFNIDAIIKANNDNKAVVKADTIKIAPPVKVPKTQDIEAYATQGVQARIYADLFDYAGLSSILQENNNTIKLLEATSINGKFTLDATLEEGKNDTKVTEGIDINPLINLKANQENNAINLILDDPNNTSIFKETDKVFKDQTVLLGKLIDKANTETEKVFSDSLKVIKDPASTNDAKEKAAKSIADLNTTAYKTLSNIISSGEPKDVIVDSLNALANLNAIAGVKKEAYKSMDRLNDAVLNHAKEGKKDIWVQFIKDKNSKNNVDLNAQKMNYEAKNTGIVLGSDLKGDENTNLGIAVFYDKGKVDSNTKTTAVKNDTKSYGLSLYGKKAYDEFNLLGNLAFTRASNDLKYNLLDEVFTGKGNSTNISLNVEVNKDITKGNSTLTPYAGLGITRLGSSNITTTSGFTYDEKASTVVALPFGVRYETKLNVGSYTLKPYGELGYTAILSGKKAKANLMGLPKANAEIENTVLDNTLQGKLGVTMENGNNEFALSYSKVKGNSTNSSTWLAEAVFKF